MRIPPMAAHLEYQGPTTDRLARGVSMFRTTESECVGLQLLTHLLVSIGQRYIERAAVALRHHGHGTGVRPTIGTWQIAWWGCASRKACLA
jgi:hypothetical protein